MDKGGILCYNRTPLKEQVIIYCESSQSMTYWGVWGEKGEVFGDSGSIGGYDNSWLPEAGEPAAANYTSGGKTGVSLF